MTPSKFGMWVVFAIFGLGCATAPEQGLEREPVDLSRDVEPLQDEQDGSGEGDAAQDDTQEGFGREDVEMASNDDAMCDGDLISTEAVEQMLILTEI